MDIYEFPFDKNLLAYCGLYCGQCSFKTAHGEQDTAHIYAVTYTFTRLDISACN
jgi:hypothetical protein